jgi:hypothetical protein
MQGKVLGHFVFMNRHCGCSVENDLKGERLKSVRLIRRQVR